MNNGNGTVSTVEVVFTFIRRLVTFVLGCWIIGNALVHPDERISQLIVGMIMVGVLPIENVFSWRVERRATAPSSEEGHHVG